MAVVWFTGAPCSSSMSFPFRDAFKKPKICPKHLWIWNPKIPNFAAELLLCCPNHPVASWMDFCWESKPHGAMVLAWHLEVDPREHPNLKRSSSTFPNRTGTVGLQKVYVFLKESASPTLTIWGKKTGSWDLFSPVRTSTSSMLGCEVGVCRCTWISKKNHKIRS